MTKEKVFFCRHWQGGRAPSSREGEHELGVPWSQLIAAVWRDSFLKTVLGGSSTRPCLLGGLLHTPANDGCHHFAWSVALLMTTLVGLVEREGHVDGCNETNPGK